MSDAKVNTAGLSPVVSRLMDDHEQIRTLLLRLKKLIRNISLRQASDCLKEAQELLQALVRVMNAHAYAEERAVFPALAKYHPVRAMEAEHAEILLLKAAVVSGVLNYSFPEDCTNRIYKEYLDFFNVFQEHLSEEENSIFPLLEHSLTPEENQRIAELMDAIRAQT